WCGRAHMFFFFFSSRRRHTRCYRDWSSDVCSSDLLGERPPVGHGVARALALPGHLGAKPLLIDLDASLRCQLTCELERKTEGVVQAKNVRTRDCLSTARLDLFKLFHPLLEGPREAVR